MAKQMQKKTQSKKRGNKIPGIVGVSHNRSIFPPRFSGKMFYDTAVSLAPAAGAVAINVFRWNSVYDPDYTNVGATAQAYTALSGLYGRYRVVSARAVVEFVNTSAATPATVFIALNPVNTIGVDITRILAQRFVWTRGIGTATGSASITHEVKGKVAAIYGVPEKQVRDEDDYASVVGGNPNNQVFMHIGAYANGAAAGAVTAHVRIEYDVIWSLPLETTW